MKTPLSYMNGGDGSVTVSENGNHITIPPERVADVLLYLCKALETQKMLANHANANTPP